MNRYFEDKVTLLLNQKIRLLCFIYFRSTNSVATHRNIPAAAGSSKAAGFTNGTNGVSSSDEDMEINWKDSIKSISVLFIPEKVFFLTCPRSSVLKSNSVHRKKTIPRKDLVFIIFPD